MDKKGGAESAISADSCRVKTRCLVTLALLVALAAGCQKSLKSTRTFRLPDGDPNRGKAAFIALKCVNCHTVDGVELPKPTEPAEKTLALGGKVARLRTYGDLLTSIVHPAASLSDALPLQQQKKMEKSPMPSVNDMMTVKELIDLVAFIQPRYVRLDPLYEIDYPTGP